MAVIVASMVLHKEATILLRAGGKLQVMVWLVRLWVEQRLSLLSGVTVARHCKHWWLVASPILFAEWWLMVAVALGQLWHPCKLVHLRSSLLSSVGAYCWVWSVIGECRVELTKRSTGCLSVERQSIKELQWRVSASMLQSTEEMLVCSGDACEADWWR